jgi:hypothetical protein
MKIQRESDDNEQSKALIELKEQHRQLSEEYRRLKEGNEDQIKELMRSLKSSVSQFDNEKALLNQKISYLENQLKET